MQNKLKQVCLASLVFAFLLFSGRDAVAKPDTQVLDKSVVRIVEVDRTRNKIVRTGTGFVINDQGHIATNVHVIAGNNQIIAIPTNSDTLYDVEVLVESSEHDLAIIRVASIDLPPITFSLAQVKKGDDVWALGYPGSADREKLARDPTLTKGIIGRIFSGAWRRNGQTLTIIQHGAATNPGNSGGPLVGACGRVIGVNTQASLAPIEYSSGQRVRVTRGAAIYWSSHIEELVKLLRAHNISFQSEDKPCLPANDAGSGEAIQKADQANEKATQAGKKAAQAQSKVEEMVSQFLLIGIVLGGLTLAALGLALKKPRQQLVHVAGQISQPISRVVEQISQPIRRRERDGAVQRRLAEQRPARGLVLAGFDGRGNRVHIALSPEKFAEQRLGLSLGRQPELVDEVVNDEHVSRRHLRISFRDDRFYIEDLNASNGTFLHRRRLSPFQPAQLDYGATVALGGLEVLVSKL